MLLKSHNCHVIKKGKVLLAGEKMLDSTRRERRKNDTTVRQAEGRTVYTQHRASQQQRGSGQLYVVTRHGYEKEVLGRTPKVPYTRNHEYSLAGQQEQAWCETWASESLSLSLFFLSSVLQKSGSDFPTSSQQRSCTPCLFVSSRPLTLARGIWHPPRNHALQQCYRKNQSNVCS